MLRKYLGNGEKAVRLIFFHDNDLILGLVTDSLVADTALEGLVSAINVKEAAPSHISNDKAKANMAHKKGTVNKVVENSRHSMVTPDYSARKINIGLDKAKQIIRVTTKYGICTVVHPISRRYIIDNLYLSRRCICGMWYVEWMPAATKLITQCRDELIYSNGTLHEVYPK